MIPLYILVLVPLIGALITGFSCRGDEDRPAWAALTTSVLLLILICIEIPRIPLSETGPILHSLGSGWRLSLDGLSALMLLVTAVSTIIAVLASWRSVDHGRRGHFAAILVIEASLVGLFLADDLLLFYGFFELSLVPMFLLIAVWGSANRRYAAIKYAIYTLFGSLPMFLAMIFIAIKAAEATGTFSFALSHLAGAPGLETGNPELFILATIPLRVWIFMALVMAFIVKVPAWPLHTWLPDAHTEAPTAGSVLLAAVLLKMGGYGLLRVAIPLLPDAALHAAPLFRVIGVIGIIYGAWMAWMQTDAKRLIAYSSVSHMGFVILGIFTFTSEGIIGAVFVMVAHALTSAALFFWIGSLYERRHDRSIDAFGGLATLAPGYSGWTGVAIFASAALPGTASFVGEFLVLYGTITRSPSLAAISALGMVFSAVYILNLARKVLFGRPTDGFIRTFSPFSRREIMTVALLAVLLVIFGLWPGPIIRLSEPVAGTVRAMVTGL